MTMTRCCRNAVLSPVRLPERLAHMPPRYLSMPETPPSSCPRTVPRVEKSTILFRFAVSGRWRYFKGGVTTCFLRRHYHVSILAVRLPSAPMFSAATIPELLHDRLPRL